MWFVMRYWPAQAFQISCQHLNANGSHERPGFLAFLATLDSVVGLALSLSGAATFFRRVTIHRAYSPPLHPPSFGNKETCLGNHIWSFCETKENGNLISTPVFKQGEIHVSRKSRLREKVKTLQFGIWAPGRAPSAALGSSSWTSDKVPPKVFLSPVLGCIHFAVPIFGLAECVWVGGLTGSRPRPRFFLFSYWEWWHTEPQTSMLESHCLTGLEGRGRKSRLEKSRWRREVRFPGFWHGCLPTPAL